MIEKKSVVSDEVTIPLKSQNIMGFLQVPEGAKGVVLFAHGSGSSRHSPRNQWVAKFLQDNGIGTLLMDLLTHEEEIRDQLTLEYRFNLPFLAERLMQVTDWVQKEPKLHSLNVGYFGASTGAGAALIAAAQLGEKIKAVVSRGGRPDLAGQALYKVISPTLLIIGGADFGVLELNRKAYDLLHCTKKLEIVPGATHLFEEFGALEEVARMTSLWFQNYL